MGKKQYRWNIILLLASLAFVLIFFELVLRGWEPNMDTAFDGTIFAVKAPPEMIDAFTWDGDGNSLAHIRSDNPLLVYELRPNTKLNEYIFVNTLGFRDYEYSIAKPPDTFRICVIGDSITFGWWERLEETYPKVLENLLNSHANPPTVFEVWNMGIGGYNAEQEMEIIRSRALKYNPDLIVIGYCTNDHQIGADGGLWRHFTRSGSRAWDWISLRILQVRELFAHEKMLPRSWKQIAEITSSVGIPVVVIFFYPQNPTTLSLKEIQRDKKVAEDLGFGIVDLFEPFAAAGWENTMSDLAHPNALGHQIAAKTLFNFLRQATHLQVAQLLLE